MRRKTGVLAAVGVVITLTAAACSSSSTSSPSGNNNTTGTTTGFNAGVTGVVNQSTQKGGTITFDNSSAPDSTDAGNTYYAFNLNFTRLYVVSGVAYSLVKFRLKA